MGKEVQKWADEAMFTSEKHNASEGPKVHLLAMNADPLGSVAACAKMYKGEVVRSLSDVTHEERKYYLGEIQKTKLAMPLESVTFHFMFENVTRAFTHQLVRQRTAAYAQESMRFAVVEDMTEAVALPPSLAGTLSLDEWLEKERGGFSDTLRTVKGDETFIEQHASKQQKWRFRWDQMTNNTSEGYNYLVNDGMPAEDARGQMPTNIITRVNYITNLRGLLDHAGNRLCTQAQFEWRLVFAQIANAISEYEPHAAMIKSTAASMDKSFHSSLEWMDNSDAWQFEAIAGLLRPVCYQTGKCAFMADFDRKCSIRSRVNANADINRPSTEWDKEYDKVEGNPIVSGVGPNSVMVDEKGAPVFIGAIRTEEWLMNPGAAR